MAISIDAIKALRDKTGASLKDVREALESAGGDEGRAVDWLRKRGAKIAQMRQAKAAEGTAQGLVGSYVHHDGRLAAIVEVNCETDFVARTPDFTQFCREVAMHIAARNPRYIRPEDAPAEVRSDTDELKAVCLLEQPFVRDEKTTIGAMLQLLTAKTGEHLAVKRFARFATGQPPTVTSA